MVVVITTVTAAVADDVEAVRMVLDIVWALKTNEKVSWWAVINSVNSIPVINLVVIWSVILSKYLL